VSTPPAVGLFLSNQQPPERDPLEALDEQFAMVHRVREAGWDSVFTGHHYLLEQVRKLQPVPFIARLAAETGDMQVGIAILLLALENPVGVAETLSSLDVVSRGKLVFAAALGYREVEHDAFAVPRGQRVERFERNLDLVTRLVEGDEVTTDLPWCKLDRARLVNLPVQRPRFPIWIGANSGKAIERAARMADSWIINPHARRDTVVEQMATFRAAREAAGRHPAPSTLPALKEIYCAETREQAWQECLPYLGAKYRTYLSWGQDSAMPSGDSLDRPVDELVDQRFIVGSPEDCLSELRAWRDEVGVDHFILRTEWAGMPSELAMRSLELLTDEVVPAFKGA
jgi:alkanesulfonate monooxygenase SsuD/methylene tetrahydromethanopterin reductase-like flavin-dependent oxidoreductase (luciferase family)